ncbi:hypothetical protein [Poseidonocella sedimentorum]|uniref:Cyclic nucleotide-binding domain-containing protein n=1 Tax=Poseidonocella sedimentorum TaxID=871652 RepID=A0A1I6DPI7_9RHOB|nr:hypothetical protein [Poseidonocella sedimentorum]SFR07345.1 hypothetical protein SAMN04515673_104214 [Poseidonocella sedimentorum]
MSIDQGLAVVLFAGLLFKAAGFLVRDELVLRALVVIGMACDIAFYTLQPNPILHSILTNGFLTAINLLLIVLIVLERTTLSMSDREKALFAAFPTLRPGQFRRVVRHARWHRAEAQAQLIDEGAPVERLFYIQSPRFEIEKQGQRYSAEGPAFAGELVFLKGGLSSASVWVPAGSDYISFDSAALHRTMARSVPLSNAMIALFGEDLARKVANSVPLPCPPPQDPPPTSPSPAPEFEQAG